MNKQLYANYRNLLSTTHAKKNHYQNLINDNKTDTSRMWKAINKILHKNRKPQMNKSFVIENDVTSDESKIANGFNNYFSSIATKLADKLPRGRFPPKLCEWQHSKFFCYVPCQLG